MRWISISTSLVSILSAFLRCSALSVGTTDNPTQKATRLIPSYITARHLTQSYPETIFSKLFSSVPKREFAIKDISLDFGWNPKEVSEERQTRSSNLGLTLLVGRSASGKSTLLRIISGQEEPLSGFLCINGQNIYKEKGSRQMSVQPVTIDSKPDCYDDNLNVMDRIVQAGSRSLSLSKDKVPGILDDLANEFAILLGLEGQLSKKPSQLTPSGQYLFGLCCACMESSCHSLNLEEILNQDVVNISCPILLLDELMDAEHSDIAKTVGKGLLKLTSKGAIVIAATHRPQHLKSVADRTVTLSSGKVLLQEFPSKEEAMKTI